MSLSRTARRRLDVPTRAFLTNRFASYTGLFSQPDGLRTQAAPGYPGQPFVKRPIQTSYAPNIRLPQYKGSRTGSRHFAAASGGMGATSLVRVGRHTDFEHTRYAITLSSGKRIVLFRLPTIASGLEDPVRCSNGSMDGWSYYAMEAECPHAGGPMGDAQIDIEDSAYIASCPWHAYDFNVETGESSYGIKACTFPVVIEAGQLHLALDQPGTTVASTEPISEIVKFKHGSRSNPSQLPDGSFTDQTGFAPDASLSECCNRILYTTDPETKIDLTTQLFAHFAKREQTDPMPLGAGSLRPPDEPPRETRHANPWEIPKPGKGGTLKSRIAMLHALANIEQWAIDLAIDICIRFATFETQSSTPRKLPRTFYYDWLKVANDEAKHFSLLRSRLEELGSHFGALPVHHGLWDSAKLTCHDLRARICIIALVHEARGLDVNPMTIDKFRRARDAESVEVLSIIHHDEITHVTTGHRWLTWICEREGTDPVAVFRSNVQKYFRGAVKGPFNADARRQAGMSARYYEDLVGTGPPKAHVIAGG